MMMYAVGLGPGDPDYITVKAIDILKRSDTIFVPGSSPDRSISRNIIMDLARMHNFSSGKEIVDLEFPMTRNHELNRRSWEKNVKMILESVASGRIVSYATLGNPTLYSTFGNILDDLRRHGVEIAFIAGVSSIDACSSIAGINLARGDESIAIITYSDFLKQNRIDFDTVIIMKVPGGSTVLEEIKRRFPEFKSSTYLRRCTMPQQIIMDRAGGDEDDYFSMVILRRY
ncbi:MAG: precorrin-2 C(20)-methyltransferase [Thermoplasmata archaeon]